MKIFKSRLLYFLLGVVVTSCVGVYASTIISSSIGYKNGTVEEALDNLYDVAGERLYLYWKGNTYDSVTGGWGTTITSNTWSTDNNSTINRKNAVFNTEAGYIDLTINNTFQYVIANTLNKIDCRDYNYITIWYDMKTTYSTLVKIDRDLNAVYYSSSSLPRIYQKDLKTSSSNIISYPINCSEPGYISISTLRGIASDPVTDLKVYGVYLSKVNKD